MYIDKVEQKNHKKKILISGGRAPFALELIRIFAQEGHEVHMLEFLTHTLSSYSKYTYKTHIISAPNNSEGDFCDELIGLLENENFDLLIPTCEESIYLSKYKSDIQKYTRLFSCDYHEIQKLHDKEDFINLLKLKKLPYPKIFKDHSLLDKTKKYILKKKISRFGGHVKILTGQQIQDYQTTDEHIVQELLNGKEHCLYLIVLDGVITAKSLYPKQFSIQGGATNYFENTDISSVTRWAESFFKDTKMTGQFSFDLFIENDVISAIECNPRTTSGVHLLRSELSLTQFFSSEASITPKKNEAFMLALPMIIFSLNPLTIFDWLKKFFKAKDAVFMFRDLKPSFGQFISLFVFYKVAKKYKLKLVDATTRDIEFNSFK